MMPPAPQRRNARENLWLARRREEGADALSRPEDAACGQNLEIADADVLHLMESMFSTEDRRGLWPAMRARRVPLGGATHRTLAVANRLSAADNTLRKFERQVNPKIDASILGYLNRSVRLTTKFSDRTPAYQHAGAVTPRRAGRGLARGRALYVSRLAATPS